MKTLITAEKLIAMLDFLKRLHGARWPEVSAPYREIINGAMKGSGDSNPFCWVIGFERKQP